MIMTFEGKTPEIGKAAFIAENATIIGDVALEEGSSIWYGAVLRGDEDAIRIGKNSNIQEHTVLHVDRGRPIRIGDRVTVGHGCIIHGCTIGDDCLIGMGAIVMNGAKIGNNCLVGAGALVTEGKEFPDHSLILGSPAKIRSDLSEEASRIVRGSAAHYFDEARKYSEISAPSD